MSEIPFVIEQRTTEVQDIKFASCKCLGASVIFFVSLGTAANFKIF